MDGFTLFEFKKFSIVEAFIAKLVPSDIDESSFILATPTKSPLSSSTIGPPYCLDLMQHQPVS